MTSPSFPFVRKILAVDALTCVAAGALMSIGAGPLAQATDLPQPLLFGAGLSLFPVAALFGWMSRTRHLNAPLINLAVVGNAAWVLASLAVLVAFPPTPFGYVFVLAQASAVAVLAWLERRGAARVSAGPVAA